MIKDIKEMSTDFEVEVATRIYSKHGYYYEIGTDPDSLSMVQIRYYNDVADVRPTYDISFDPDMADAFVSGILRAKESFVKRK